MTTPEVRQLARDAAAEIRRRGWTSGELAEMPIWWSANHWRDDEKIKERYQDCKVCALGGIAAADNPAVLRSEAFEELSDTARSLVDKFVSWTYADIPDEVITPEIGVGPTDLVALYNDHVAKTADDVLRVFDGIASGEL